MLAHAASSSGSSHVVLKADFNGLMRTLEQRVESALEELCVKYGYCIPPSDVSVLVADPPRPADAFVDAVLVAEGLDPFWCDKQRRRELRGVVQKFLGEDW